MNKKLNLNCPQIKPVKTNIKRPFFSVMIPVVDRTKYLTKAIESVLQQEIDSETMEIEVIDNSSTDENKSEIKSLVKAIAPNRISYYQQPHQLKIAENWNTCLNRAKGEWIHILHDDDFVLPNFYALLKQGIEKESSIGAAFCRAIYIDENNYPQNLSGAIANSSGILPNWLENIAISNPILCPSIIVKRSVYEELGGFNSDLVYALDWEMWKRIASFYSFWYEFSPLACYRYHHDSETSKVFISADNIRDTNKAIDISKTYLPPHLAEKLSNQSKEFFALVAIKMGNQMICQEQTQAAINLIAEGLKCSDSPKVMNLLINVLTQPQSYSLFQSIVAEFFLNKNK